MVAEEEEEEEVEDRGAEVTELDLGASSITVSGLPVVVEDEETEDVPVVGPGRAARTRGIIKSERKREVVEPAADERKLSIDDETRAQRPRRERQRRSQGAWTVGLL